MAMAVMHGQDSQVEQLREVGILEGKDRTTSLRHKSQSYIHVSCIRQDP